MPDHPPLTTPSSGMSRRALALAGCAAGALCAAGCARYGDSDEPTAPAAPGPPATPGPASTPGVGAGPAAVTPPPGGGGGPGVVAASDVPVGGGVILDDRSLVITQPRAGTFAAFGTTCPHQGCSVSEVAGGTINCPCHGSRFRVADGSVAKGPAKKGLAPRQVRNVDGRIQLA